jgi:hypothetical protein
VILAAAHRPGRRAAALAWPGASPVGQRLRVGDGPALEVIGVVAHERRMLSRLLPAVAYLPRPQIEGRNLLGVWAPAVGEQELAARLAAPIAGIAHGYRVTVRAVTFDGLFARDAGEAQFQQPPCDRGHRRQRHAQGRRPGCSRPGAARRRHRSGEDASRRLTRLPRRWPRHGPSSAGRRPYR